MSLPFTDTLAAGFAVADSLYGHFGQCGGGGVSFGAARFPTFPVPGKSHEPLIKCHETGLSRYPSARQGWQAGKLWLH